MKRSSRFDWWPLILLLVVVGAGAGVVADGLWDRLKKKAAGVIPQPQLPDALSIIRDAQQAAQKGDSFLARWHLTRLSRLYDPMGFFGAEIRALTRVPSGEPQHDTSPREPGPGFYGPIP